MHASARTKVKICCISSTDEARLALECGAFALGFVSAMPSGPGVIAEETISAIIAQLPPDVPSFLLTSSTEAGEIVAQQRQTKANTLQLVDDVGKDVLRELRGALPDINIIQVIHVISEESVRGAIAVAPLVDALLLDSGNPTLAVKELGGTGRVHDWSLSRRIREAVKVPVWLAGGLTPSNVQEAIGQVVPHGVDVCSGVRVEGRLNSERLSAFIQAVKTCSA